MPFSRITSIEGELSLNRKDSFYDIFSRFNDEKHNFMPGLGNRSLTELLRMCIFSFLRSSEMVSKYISVYVPEGKWFW